MEVPTWLDGESVVMTLHRSAPHGDLDELRFQFCEVFLAGARTIIVDVSDLDALNSQALAAMLTAHRACRRRGGALVLRDPGRQALHQLQRTGLWHVFRIETATDRAHGAAATVRTGL